MQHRGAPLIMVLAVCLPALGACILPAQVAMPPQPVVLGAPTATLAPVRPTPSVPPATSVAQPTLALAAPTVAPTDVLPTAEPTAAPTIPPTPTDTPAPSATPTPATAADWYRYQGAAESGECATANCGPAVVAMAIGYATGKRVSIADIRTFTSGDSCRGTDYTDAERALEHYKIDYQAIEGLDALKEAVNDRKHPVLVILYMDFILPGEDYLQPQTDPAQHFGRYHSYTSGHFVVVTGVTDDGKWVIVRDPYVFDPELAFYKDGVPKGKDRYYSYDEFKQAYRYFGYYGLEILPEK